MDFPIDGWDATLVNGVSVGARHRERIRTLNRRRQARQRREMVDDPAPDPRPDDLLALLPAWMRAEIDKAATRGAGPRPRRRGGPRPMPSPKSDRVRQLLRDPGCAGLSAREIARLAGTSRQLVEKVRAEQRAQRDAQQAGA